MWLVALLLLTTLALVVGAECDCKMQCFCVGTRCMVCLFPYEGIRSWGAQWINGMHIFGAGKYFQILYVESVP